MEVTVTELIAENIYRIGERISGVDAELAVYFIKDGNGAIVEPGPASITPKIVEAAASLGITSPDYIFPTHIHLDHAGGSGELLKCFPGARLVVNRHGVKHLIDPSRLIKSTRLSFGEDYEKMYGAILPVPEPHLKVVVDGERLKLGSREMVAIYTPGHAPHHTAFLDTMTNGVFCGESLGLIYHPGEPPLPALAPPSFNLEIYLENMRHIKEMKPDMLFYSHGTVSHEPERNITEVMANTRLIADLILRELKSGNDVDTITVLVDEFIKTRFHAVLDEYELITNVKGFTYYFRKHELV
jgi:glyoxylase-like metal-dependent hydrolase (beta-lactamase superfamily II)